MPPADRPEQQGRIRALIERHAESLRTMRDVSYAEVVFLLSVARRAGLADEEIAALVGVSPNALAVPD